MVPPEPQPQIIPVPEVDKEEKKKISPAQLDELINSIPDDEDEEPEAPPTFH